MRSEWNVGAGGRMGFLFPYGNLRIKHRDACTLRCTLMCSGKMTMMERPRMRHSSKASNKPMMIQRVTYLAVNVVVSARRPHAIGDSRVLSTCLVLLE
jgi:hypothetical protein